MLKETVQLENLRQQIEDVDYEQGNQADYLDRGGPNAAQKRKAEEKIAHLLREEQQLKRQLHERIEQTRREKPEALAEWVKIHTEILKRIAAENTSGGTAPVRRSMAEETLAKWNKVLAGEQEYVNINWYFLKDYKTQVRKTFKQSWWQFWK